MNKTDKIIELKELLDSGRISIDDFERLKKQVFIEPEKVSSELNTFKQSESKENIHDNINIDSNLTTKCLKCGSTYSKKESECKICKNDLSDIADADKSIDYPRINEKKSKYILPGLLIFLSVIIGFVYYGYTNKSIKIQKTKIQQTKTIIDSVKVYEESLNQKLKWIWAKATNGRKLNSVNFVNGKLITDSKGNIYVIGDFHGETIAFDNITSESIGDSDNNWNTYFTKYDKNGNVKWVQIIKEYDEKSIAIDSNDDIYISFNENLIAKYNSDGKKIWEKSTTMSGIKIDIKSVNSLYVVGTSDYPNYNVLKYDSEGNVLWNKELRTIKIEGESIGLDLKVTSLKTDINGNLYICGSFGGAQLKLENTILYRKGINCKITDQGCDMESNNGFIIKFDKNGNCKWAKNLGVENYYNNTFFSHLELDENGNIYILADCYSPDGGTFFNESKSKNILSFFIKYDNDGNILWTKKIESCSNFLSPITFEALTINKFGNIYIAGSSRCNNLTFGKYTEYASNGELNFIAKYNPDGEVISAKSFNNGELETTKISFDDIKTDENGNLFIFGTYKGGEIKFGNSILKKPSDSNSLFIFKLKTVEND